MKIKELVNNIEIKKLNKKNHKFLLKILKIRNEEKVRFNMINSNIISKKNHFDWIKRTSKKKILYSITYKKNIIGCITLNIDTKNYFWEFYISTKLPKIYGGFIEYKFLNFYFKNYKKKNLFCCVVSFNESVIKLHKKFGFKIYKLKKNFLIKNNNKYDLIYLKINNTEWKKNSKIFKNKFKLK